MTLLFDKKKEWIALNILKHPMLDNERLAKCRLTMLDEKRSEFYRDILEFSF